MHQLIAQREIFIKGLFEGIGPLGLEGRSKEEAPSLFNTFLARTIGLLTMIAAIWFTFSLVSGAISWITSGGDKAQVEAARARVVTGVVGLVILFSIWAGIKLIEGFFGINILTLDILNLAIR